MNSYIPYHTTIPLGDVLRDPTQRETQATTSLVNFMRRFYVRQTGYTQQNYSTRNTLTKQTLLAPVKQIGHNLASPDYINAFNTPKAGVKDRLT